jgi:hypothetical protein
MRAGHLQCKYPALICANQVVLYSHSIVNVTLPWRAVPGLRGGTGVLSRDDDTGTARQCR